MYSVDRFEALECTLSILKQSPIYDRCQKTLVVDGKIDVVPAEWQPVQVPRLDGKFCWGRMWDAGVCSAKHKKIVYLDSDRMLPKNFLETTQGIIRDDIFVFTSKHYMIMGDVSLDDCKRILDSPRFNDVMANEYVGKFKYENRFGEPFHGPSKNVMSGSVGFTKDTYYRLGGVDHWYCGHGAYADSDFHMQAAVGGCRFIDLSMPELHFPHPKIEKGNKLGREDLYRLGLDNFIYYCKKWDLPASLTESLAARCGVARPRTYVSKRWKDITSCAKE